MTLFTAFFDDLRCDEAGATAIEYGLMAALISIVAITAMGAVGNSLTNTFNFIITQENTAQSGQL